MFQADVKCALEIPFTRYSLGLLKEFPTDFGKVNIFHGASKMSAMRAFKFKRKLIVNEKESYQNSGSKANGPDRSSQCVIIVL